jgi:gamma-glutamyltranspeptidase/glutathione hydrolase
VAAEGHGDTVHLDVADRWGNLVSATPSGGWLQSNPAIPDLGFCLGTRLQMTWLDESSPSALTPGRRPRTTLSPTMLLRDGVPVTGLGTPGGDQQDQWQLLYLLRTIVGGAEPQAAIDAPAVDTVAMVGSFDPRTWTPAGATVESRLDPLEVDELRHRGHDITVDGPWTSGRLSMVARDPVTGQMHAAATSRGNHGYAAGR